MMLFDVYDRPGAETVLLSSGLGGAAAYWAPQLELLRARYRVVAYDHAGTGRNRKALPDCYRIEDMAAEASGVLDASGTLACHFVGPALGGLIGLALAMQAPERLLSLVVINGWARMDAHTRRCFEARRTLLRLAGVEAYVRAQALFLYPATWLATHEEQAAAEDRHGVAGFQGAETLERRIAALEAFDATAALPGLQTRTTVIAAQDDLLVSATQSEAVAAALPKATLQRLDWGGPAVHVTDPGHFNPQLLDALAGAQPGTSR